LAAFFVSYYVWDIVARLYTLSLIDKFKYPMLFKYSYMSDFEEKRKADKEAVEIKIRLSKKTLRWIERSIFIIIILTLGILVYYSPFCNVKCEKGLSELTSVPVAGVDNNSTEPEIEEEPVVEEEPEPEPQLSGKVTLGIDNIELDENKTRIESITIKIDNQKKIFTPTVYVYWYDPDSLESMKQNPRSKITYVGAISAGTIKTWKLDTELTAHYLIADDDDKEVFKVELYDGAILLDTESKVVTTS